MLLISPDYLEIPLFPTIPLQFEAYSIPHSKPLHGKTPKGHYIFQNLLCGNIHACFSDLFPISPHRIMLLKKTPSFFLVVQLHNTLNCEFNNLPREFRHEWSINFYRASNFYNEITLPAGENLSTFFLWVSDELVQRVCKSYPIVERFYRSQKDERHSDKLFKQNLICNFRVIDLIRSLQYGADTHIDIYIDLLKACFELFSASSTLKQCDIPEEFLSKIYSVKRFMVEHLGETIIWKSLCNQYGLTTHKLTTGFKNIYGVSPSVLLRYYRMSAVRYELRHNNAELKALAGKYHYSYNALLRAYYSIYKEHPHPHSPLHIPEK